MAMAIPMRIQQVRSVGKAIGVPAEASPPKGETIGVPVKVKKKEVLGSFREDGMMMMLPPSPPRPPPGVLVVGRPPSPSRSSILSNAAADQNLQPSVPAISSRRKLGPRILGDVAWFQ